MSNPEKNEQPAYDFLQKLKDGKVDPSTVSVAQRQGYIEILILEGHSVLQLAQLFKRTEHTIRADLREIRDTNRLKPSIELAEKMIAEFVTYSRVHRDHLMRLARKTDASVSERSQSEYLAFKTTSETIVRLQSVGYLPSRPVTVVGDIFHHAGDPADQLEELNRQIAELGQMADGNDPVAQAVKADIEGMKKFIVEMKTQTEPNLQEESHE
ncbi:MAG: hypothetical protein HQL20_06965 [Candidatus Omnitrophica bacterium]|nr:hypothetical protein [Candidatus Omnitrophota bacterium]